MERAFERCLNAFVHGVWRCRARMGRVTAIPFFSYGRDIARISLGIWASVKAFHTDKNTSAGGTSV
jgi:hypothetical protein